MDPLWRALILFLTCIVYLFVGAGIFSVLEGHYEKVTKTDINQTIFDFLSKHKDVEVNELLTVVHKLHDAFHSGVNADEVVEGTYHNRWDVVNAFYFCVTTITTIGFGHLSPATSAGKVLFGFYAFFGIPLMAWFLIESGTLMKERILLMSQKIQNGLSHCIRANFLRLFITTLIFVLTGYVILLVIPAAIIASIEGWGHADAQYFCFVSLTTIGFGDLIATEHTSGWVEWVYKLATTMYYFNGMVVLTAVACILYEKRPAPKMATHERLMNNGGQVAVEEQMREQMVADPEERELALGHLTLQEAEGHVEVTVEDDYEDDNSDDGGGDGKYRKL